MNFVSETISPEDQARIIRDAGPELAKLYRLRRGYFDNFPGTMWAIDRERHAYLLLAPMADYRRTIPTYHFFFHGMMYTLELRDAIACEITCINPPPDNQLEAFEAAVLEAFEVHGPDGMPLACYRYRFAP